ncbi:MAG: DUF4153 domain-containing protein [Methylophilaceae bacterium]
MADLATQKNEKWFILGTALLQGLVLLIIRLWADTLPNKRQYFDVILPLYVLAISLPLSLMLLAHQPRKLAFSLAGAFSLLAAFCGLYFGDISYVKKLYYYGSEGLVFQFGFCMVVVWFICVTFIEHYCQYQHWFKRYDSLYDFSWRNAVKLITASIFTGLFWAALLLLAGLFKVLGIKLFDDIISSSFFIYPATAVAVGLGLSLYDAKQEALSEFKRAILQVLGWLLPLVSLILIAFICTLPFKGLIALWSTGYATSMLLGLIALMVFLLNTAFQDGKQAQYPAWLLKLANLAVLTMPIYAWLCIYAMYLRVAQYGWTDDRVWAAGFTFIATLYSVGYAYAAIKSFKQTAWMQAIKPVNVLTAVCLVVLIGLIYSPVLNPVRIGVQSQLARLSDGKVTADVYDYDYLRFSGGKYGDAALRGLLADTNHPQAKTMKPLIEEVLKSDYPVGRAYSAKENKALSRVSNAEALQALTTIYPKGTLVDKAFFDMLFQEYKSGKVYFSCLDDASIEKKMQGCNVLSIDLNKDHQDELMVLSDYGGRVYQKQPQGWRYLSDMQVECCNALKPGEVLTEAELATDLAQGKVSAAEPKWQDLKIGDQTYKIVR